MRVSRTAPWVVASLTAAGLAFAFVLNGSSGAFGTSIVDVLGWGLATLASTGVGLLLATRRRENSIGWLLLANGLILAALALAEAYADYAVLAHPGALPGAAWGILVSERAWPLLFAAITAIAWIFPRRPAALPALAPLRDRRRDLLRRPPRRLSGDRLGAIPVLGAMCGGMDGSRFGWSR